MLSVRPTGPSSETESLGLRVASAAVAIPLLLLLVWLGSLWLAAAAGLVTAVGALEYYRLLTDKVARPLMALGLLWALLFIIDGHRGGDLVVLLVTVGPPLLLVLSLPFHRQGSLLKGWLLATGGPLYLGLTLSHALLLRQLDGGDRWLALALFTAFATDTAAYLVGRMVGRHRLAPRISPGKTWEGAAAGLVGGTIAAMALVVLLDLPAHVWQAALIGAGVGIVSQAGDLLESSLKRYAQAKDAGRLIPGHGGLLDRLDSVVPSLVLVYYGATWVVP